MFAGIDCSKDTFDLAILDQDEIVNQDQFSNDQKGFDQLTSYVQSVQLVIIEATGPYYLRLALDLYHQNIPVAVINPLVIKRFAQMKMTRAKTDKQDACLIAQYGQYERPALWQPPSTFMLRMQQLDTYVQGLMNRRQMAANQLHAFKHNGQLDDEIQQGLEEEIDLFDQKIRDSQKQITRLMIQEHKRLLDILQSIPGIGPQSAYLIILATNGFASFENYKQVISYFGLAPRIYNSGTSVKSRASICKMGMARVRRTLYMAARSAIRCNRACKQLYERLRAKGKSHKLALVAAANKLIKQAFGIAKSGKYYDENHVSEPV